MYTVQHNFINPVSYDSKALLFYSFTNFTKKYNKADCMSVERLI